MSNIESFIQECVYYPCSGTDGAPVKFLSSRFRKFFYTDSAVDRNRFISDATYLGFYGYILDEVVDLNVVDVFGGSWEDVFRNSTDSIRSVCDPIDPTAASISSLRFRRVRYLNEDHGPKHFEIWFARCEAVAVYRSVFQSRGVQPKCLAYIRPGVGFGRNYGEYPQVLEKAIRANQGGLPSFILHDEEVANSMRYDYFGLVRNYVRIDSWSYETEHYGRNRLIFGGLEINVG